ncbi:class I SAM-dependent methyltransferase [Cellulosimicrobium protaetiae]|uniref:SAM-dependent methyltransferase n=1 Tax=Cellulosimicrobium protaetiae TaxID=2587808 RepID=A0A6M5UAU1_9MICO|nr:class I SAM-dependent methyltransferase [Cellulosimicrobium protaetiae]QJW35224.1 SAM-dependent methyltransferase [Cellulosimicrobium protaetiae]
MRPFDELITEAGQADVTGWGFGWLDGRATEERPPWRFVSLLSQHLGQADAALDLDTGGGEVLAEALGAAADRGDPTPATLVASEAWAPNAARARERLAPWGGRVVVPVDGALPVADASFVLVTARHPVAPAWSEIHRVLRPGGTYLAQHVGPGSAFELIEAFLGPQPEARTGRDPEDEAAQAHAAGLDVVELRTATCRMELHDVGAVVWLLRKCVWWVPDFSVDRYRGVLEDLDARLRAGARDDGTTSTPFVARSTRHLVVARQAG